jgi:gamma-glutamyltranspeptidase
LALPAVGPVTLCSQKKSSPFRTNFPPARARHGMVASSQPLAAQVGLQVLKDGGNAVPWPRWCL